MQLRILIAGVLLAVPLPAMAGNSGEPDPGLVLGPLQTYVTEPAARAACGEGQVVWAERYAGYFYKPGEARFGSAAPGGICLREGRRRRELLGQRPHGRCHGLPREKLSVAGPGWIIGLGHGPRDCRTAFAPPGCGKRRENSSAACVTCRMSGPNSTVREGKVP